MKIFVTGCAAHLAKTLLPTLCADARITTVTGIDLKPCHFTHKKFDFHRLDIRHAQVKGIMQGHDALIHLAFVVLRGKMPIAAMRAINVEASFEIFKHAAASGITRLIHLSSASVYGNGENLTEAAPLKPLPGFVYAEHKAELERQLAQEFPSTLRLRPHIILGPNALPLLKRILRLPFYLKLSEPQPLLQCVHEYDVAQAILLGVFSGCEGPIHLAGADAMSLKAIIKAKRPRAFGISLPMAQTFLSILWRISGWGGEPAWLSGAEKSLTLNCNNAYTMLGWKPIYSTPSAIKSM